MEESLISGPPEEGEADWLAPVGGLMVGGSVGGRLEADCVEDCGPDGALNKGAVLMSSLRSVYADMGTLLGAVSVPLRPVGG
jgi:hypothetical protein